MEPHSPGLREAEKLRPFVREEGTYQPPLFKMPCVWVQCLLLNPQLPRQFRFSERRVLLEFSQNLKVHSRPVKQKQIEFVELFSRGSDRLFKRDVDRDGTFWVGHDVTGTHIIV